MVRTTMCERDGCKGLVKPTGKRFCSLSCANSVNTKNRPKIVRPTTKCENSECNTEYEITDKRQKYCSRSCRTIVSNKRRTGRRICAYVYCNEKTYAKKQKFCCLDHMSSQTLLEKAFTAIVSGELPSSYPSCKRILEHLYGWECQIVGCGVTHWMGVRAPMVLDHIDGDASNHVLSNIRLVCGNCNMQLPTFAGRNYGNGRPERRARYLKST